MVGMVPINQSTNQSTKQSINQSIEQAKEKRTKDFAMQAHTYTPAVVPVHLQPLQGGLDRLPRRRLTVALLPSSSSLLLFVVVVGAKVS